jgi:hypothetical protein
MNNAETLLCDFTKQGLFYFNKRKGIAAFAQCRKYYITRAEILSSGKCKNFAQKNITKTSIFCIK